MIATSLSKPNYGGAITNAIAKEVQNNNFDKTYSKETNFKKKNNENTNF